MKDTDKEELSIGQTIKKARLEKGLSLRALGELTGLSYGYLSRVENDKPEYPLSEDSFLKVVRAVGIAEPLDLLVQKHLQKQIPTWVQRFVALKVEEALTEQEKAHTKQVAKEKQDLIERIKQKRLFSRQHKAENEGLSSWFNGELYILDWILSILDGEDTENI